MTFKDDQLQSDEKIILQVNPHWITVFRPLLGAFIHTLIWGSLSFFIVFRFEQKWGYYILLLLIPVYLKFTWKLMLRANKEYIITNLRIVKQEGVFSKTSMDSSLDKINNVYHRQGLWGRILGYGHVGLDTASEQGTTVFHHIPKPLQFKNAIISQQQAYRTKLHSSPVSMSPREEPNPNDVPALLQKLGELRDKGIISPEEFQAKKQDLLSRI